MNESSPHQQSILGLYNRIDALGPHGDTRVAGALAVLHPEILVEMLEYLEALDKVKKP